MKFFLWFCIINKFVGDEMEQASARSELVQHGDENDLNNVCIRHC